MVAIQRLHEGDFGDFTRILALLLDAQQRPIPFPVEIPGVEARAGQHHPGGFDRHRQLFRVGQAAQRDIGRIATGARAEQGSHVLEALRDGVGIPIAGAGVEHARSEVGQTEPVAVASAAGVKHNADIDQRQTVGRHEIHAPAPGRGPMLNVRHCPGARTDHQQAQRQPAGAEIVRKQGFNERHGHLPWQRLRAPAPLRAAARVQGERSSDGHPPGICGRRPVPVQA